MCRSVFERLVRHFIWSTSILGRSYSCTPRRPSRNVMQRNINVYVRLCSVVLRSNQMLQDQVLCSHAGAPILKRRAMIRSWYRSLPKNMHSSQQFELQQRHCWSCRSSSANAQHRANSTQVAQDTGNRPAQAYGQVCAASWFKIGSKNVVLGHVGACWLSLVAQTTNMLTWLHLQVMSAQANFVSVVLDIPGEDTQWDPLQQNHVMVHFFKLFQLQDMQPHQTSGLSLTVHTATALTCTRI